MPENRQIGYKPNGNRIPLEQGTNWLLVIGIDQYEHHRNLKKAVADAKGFAEIMTTRYGFKHLQPPLYDEDATQRNIRRALGQCKTLGEHDRLIVFYAGHGWYESKTNLGHIVPTEAEDDPDSDFIPTNFITNIFQGVDAKHILLIVDCCFGGSFGVERNMMDVEAVKKVNRQLDTKRSRMVLSSGGLEPVSDGLVSANNSPFTSPLLAILADNQSPVLVMSEIFPLLRKKANWETDHQMAQYKVLQGLKHGDGELGFYCTDLESAEERAYKAAIQTDSIPMYEDFLYEDAFTDIKFKEDITRRLREKRAADAWKRIEKSDRIEDFLETEKLLLNTPYAALANKKMDELKRIRAQQRQAQEAEQQKAAALKKQKAEAEKQTLTAKEAAEKKKIQEHLDLAQPQLPKSQPLKEGYQWLKNIFDKNKPQIVVGSKVLLGIVLFFAFITYLDSTDVFKQGFSERWLNEAMNKGSVIAPEIEGQKQIDSAIVAGKKAHDAFDYVKAFSLLDKHKENKAFDAEAQRDLGRIYCYGRGSIRNYTKALKWLQKSAAQGYAGGQFSLGEMYERGNGVKKDYKEAVKWYQKAAEQGDLDGQTSLGYMYEKGEYVEQDYKEAVKWYQKAADQGDSHGQNNLGQMYENGTGVKKDLKEAVRLYRLSAKQGHKFAKDNLKRLGYSE